MRLIRKILLGIEGVRLFDTEAFTWLRDNRNFLFNDGRFQLAEDDVKEQAIEELKRRVPEGEYPQILGMITVLFPQLAKWSDSDASFGAEGYDEVERRRGIGCEAGYDSYFGLHPSADAVRLADIDGLVAPGADVENIEKIVRGYLVASDSRGAPMITKVFHELRVRYSGRNPAQGHASTVECIVPHWRRGDFFRPRYQHDGVAAPIHDRLSSL